jgi:hypothetical protein
MMRIVDPYAVVRVSAKVFLEGPYVSSQQLMKDDLRGAGLLPSEEPYGQLGFQQIGSGHETVAAATLAVTGNDAIVDWVHLELRDATDPTHVVSTANGLLQRDGDVVAPDGVSPLEFIALPGDYYVAVRHRDHLGAMTAAPLALSATAAALDLTVGTTSTYGTGATKTIGTDARYGRAMCSRTEH